MFSLLEIDRPAGACCGDVLADNSLGAIASDLFEIGHVQLVFRHLN